PIASLVFLHGGGAHSGATYPHLATALSRDHAIAVHTPDLRGHGVSAGARGDAPSPRRVWCDIDAIVRHVRARDPDLPLYLGGHSSGAGLVLNYLDLPGREQPEGYLFLAPFFGFRARTERPHAGERFARVRVAPFIVNALTGGRLLGNCRAVHLNYPGDLLTADPLLLAFYTVNMAKALTPSDPQAQIRSLDRPFGLWIGAADELFDPERVLALADCGPAVRERSETGVLANESHLSVLLRAHTVMGERVAAWVQSAR
ncbi:MAG: alpha/beta fold hydrolase, partial [Gammaproteobacteria bacterium]|nr:alpha/beta fold hydrolase [Gammaproteobacteria bacterium]